MAAQAAAKIVFDDFSGGDYGRDWAGASTKSMFRGVNVIEYPGGWIGPRSPLVAFTPPAPYDGAGKHIWFIDNNHLLLSDGYGWNLLTGEKSLAALDDVTKLKDYFLDQFGDLACVSSDVSIQDDVVFTVNFPAKTDTVPTFVDTSGTGPSGLRAQRHEDVSVIFGNRKFSWSESEEWQVWPAPNFATVNVLAVYDAILQKNTLVCIVGSFPTTISDNLPPWGDRGGSVAGADVYVIYGTLGADATLRKVDSGPAPEVTTSGSYIFAPSGDTVYWISNRWLVSFDGSEVKTHDSPLPRILHTPTDVQVSATTFLRYWAAGQVKAQGEFVLSGSLPTTDDINRRGVFNWFHGDDSGAWTAHDPGVAFKSELPDGFPGCDFAQRGTGDFMVYNDRDKAMFFATQGRSSTGAEAPKFYKMALDSSFPLVTDDDGDTAAPVVADLYTADYWDEQMREMSVEGLWIDYAYTPQVDAPTQAATQTVTFEIESMRLDDDARPRPGGTFTFTPAFTPAGAPSEPGTEIVRGRAWIPVRSDGTGGGFRVHLSDWSGIAINRITADARINESR